MAVIEQLNQDPLSLIALPIYVIAIALEALWSWRHREGWYLARDTGVSMLMLLTSVLVEIVPRALALALIVYLHDISPLRDVVERQWWAWLALFVLDDFSYYWFHRLNHEVRLFWAGHVNHHSSEYLNLGTALRQGVGERIHKMLFWIWLPLLGFDALMIVTMIGVNLFYQFWVHTEAVRKLPAWFEAVFNTPSHHRVHHASNIRYLDRNHAGTLIVWDRLFGTFSAELDSEPPVYGLTSNLHTFNPAKVLFHGYTALWSDMRRAPGLGAKLRYIFFAPGWSHDGDDRRARTVRARMMAVGNPANDR